MKTTAVPYSKFLRGPTDVLPAIEEGDVLLERRDADDLVLTSYRRFVTRQEGMTFAARLIADVVHDYPEVARALLRRELPWLRWLPEPEQGACVTELLAELVAGADTGVLDPFVRAVRAWRATAAVWSEPELAVRLAGPFAGDGPDIERP